MKPIQHWMWSCLKKHKVFALIGRYVTEADIERVNEKMTNGYSDYISLSGDYQEATNLIRSFASERVCKRIMMWVTRNMETALKESLPKNFLIDMLVLFERSLTHHIFETKDEKGRKAFHEQLNGQLMGSITSFVMLCIINAACCRLALEKANLTTYRVSDKPTKFSTGPIAPLAVNGDDCDLCGDSKYLRLYWEAATTVVGLKTSLGKTYFGDKKAKKQRILDNTLVEDKIPKFCTINSTLFVLSEPTMEGENYIKPKWSEVKYVNLGLLYGKSRSVAGKGKEDLGTETLGNISRELKRSCPADLWLTVKQLFIKMNKAALTKHKLSWFRPEWCGGLGLPIDSDSELSQMDRKIASVIKMKMNMDRSFKPTLPKEMSTWKMHELVMKDLKPFKLETTTYKNVHIGPQKSVVKDQFSKLYKYMTIDLLFKTPLENLYEVLDDDKSIFKALKHNEKIDQRCIKLLNSQEGQAIPAMSTEDLKYETKDFNLPCFVKQFDCYDHLKDEYTTEKYTHRSYGAPILDEFIDTNLIQPEIQESPNQGQDLIL
nr:RNA-dependent RNA polymerase [Flumine narna-like virus 51]